MTAYSTAVMYGLNYFDTIVKRACKRDGLWDLGVHLC